MTILLKYVLWKKIVLMEYVFVENRFIILLQQCNIQHNTPLWINIVVKVDIVSALTKFLGFNMTIIQVSPSFFQKKELELRCPLPDHATLNLLNDQGTGEVA